LAIELVKECPSNQAPVEAGISFILSIPRSRASIPERKAPIGVKDDWLDAWSFAAPYWFDAKTETTPARGATDQRLTCVTLFGISPSIDTHALINQLRHALAEYYPAAFEALRIGLAFGLDFFAAFC